MPRESTLIQSSSTPQKTYSFPEQRRIGQIGEEILDSYLKRSYFLEPANRTLQDYEIDRIATPLSGGRSWYLEYKTDLKADTTGNAFIETIGADANRKNQGWVTKSRADILVYYLPFSGRVYVLPMTRIRGFLTYWTNRYEVKTAQNAKYRTHGLIVPLFELNAVGFLARIRSIDHSRFT
ncbi:hypothetical protein NIES2135_54330 [Leptolyngbya boryana NIES-2135]|jgi:hypothetical protein|uniref:Uncharacterized protein n=1 Tax=Leptolyngbya boryana NIES-2135 TaxID=1973484 RepID=A0A1Z4JPC6_LEPBY|nr:MULTISPECIES: hypothetical protein [Leptolyngbya]BAY58560.1 hypothetical protein NIES2135_54330 [Leptolyngbya boryana NIES-2135]MBD2370764.1 hypothetical protein [Leptolyngbya sp. FACHB-161]MBD2377083.1 hypothetical protein [Leptolyngbya sp. FACHB-238]MBD2401526.1 hypothetical protein [Leptolyngbya sp. FACHB-239]MBD2408078.1 hypothetical protein [Leptolyngbya sp. FACHB-402]